MGIYSINKPKSVIEEYIDNEFLSSCFNESFIGISNEIIGMQVTSESIMSIANEIYCSDISESAKINLYTEMFNTINSRNVVAEEALQEASPFKMDLSSIKVDFKGDPQLNADFIECLKDVELLCNYFVRIALKIGDYCVKFEDESDKILKKPSIFKDSVKKVREYEDEYIAWLKDLSKSSNLNPKTWSSYKSKIKKFNNKYSEISTEEKKKLDAKLVEFVKQLNGMIKPWAKNGDKIEKMIKNCKDMELEDDKLTAAFFKEFGKFYNTLWEEYQDTMNDIFYVRRTLKIEREDTILYKVINKILK